MIATISHTKFDKRKRRNKIKGTGSGFKEQEDRGEMEKKSFENNLLMNIHHFFKEGFGTVGRRRAQDKGVNTRW